MPTGASAPKAGLGTGIVEALVRQLHAEMRIADAAPGTMISISHLPELTVVKADDDTLRTGSDDTRGGKAY